MSFVQWVFRQASDAQLGAMGPVILYGLLKLLDKLKDESGKEIEIVAEGVPGVIKYVQRILPAHRPICQIDIHLLWLPQTVQVFDHSSLRRKCRAHPSLKRTCQIFARQAGAILRLTRRKQADIRIDNSRSSMFMHVYYNESKTRKQRER